MPSDTPSDEPPDTPNDEPSDEPSDEPTNELSEVPSDDQLYTSRCVYIYIIYAINSYFWPLVELLNPEWIPPPRGELSIWKVASQPSKLRASSVTTPSQVRNGEPNPPNNAR